MDLYPYIFCLFFNLLYFVLSPFEDNGLPFWVPDVLCQHPEVVLWNFPSVQMFFQWICGGESGLPILFLSHLQNWCFWTVVLEKTLESPLDCKEIQPVHSEGDQLWVFIGRTDVEAEISILWPPHAKSWLIGKDSDAGQEEKGTTEDEMAGWHQWVNGRESEWTPTVGDGQGGLACCDHGVAKSQTRLSDWTKLIRILEFIWLYPTKWNFTAHKF